MSDTAHAAFLEAASFAVDVLARSEIGARWNESSALARMSVGDVAGHVFLVIRRVDKHLDAPAAPDAPRGRGWAFPRVDTEADLDLDVHAGVRDDGHHVSEWGWAEVVVASRDRVDRLAGRLPAEAPEHVMLGPLAIPFADYLGSRVVELLVHADDLATSAGIDLPPLPPAAADVALVYLLAAARDVHGDLTVLRALTRRERVPPGAPAVY